MIEAAWPKYYLQNKKAIRRTIMFEIYLSDLKDDVREEVEKLLRLTDEDYGNYDVFPLFEIDPDDFDDDDEEE